MSYEGYLDNYNGGQGMNTPRTETRKLTCDMRADCTAPVTHLDEKGYVYCADHGDARKSHCRCRKLRPAERRALEAGNTVERY